jgi:FAD synthase
VLPFTPALAALPPSEFVERVLLERYCLRELVIGHDHGFGRGRAGDIHTLRELGERHDFSVGVVDAVLVDKITVSSSAVRRAVSYGELEGASRMLGRRYSFSGRVVSGNERGRSLGFLNLNIALPSVR